MKIIKFLNYFNLIVSIIVLWIYIKSYSLYYDYIFISGLVLTIWYNWSTLKRIMGQRIALGNLTYILGIITIFFGALLTLDSFVMIIRGVPDEKLHVAKGLLYIPLGISITLFSWLTLKYHKVEEGK
ncbi:MAG: hypothetical protein EBR30_17840 [Cytophagia bacterium]|nr:hypothetical protein [Cytophagia bacterium]